MSIKRVSDLPSIEDNERQPMDKFFERLGNSFIELSFLSTEAPQTYSSRKWKYGEMMDALKDMLRFNLALSGNFSVNDGVDAYPNYNITLSAGHIRLGSTNPVEIQPGIRSRKGEFDELSAYKDLSATQHSPYDAVNCGYLSAYVAQEIDKLRQELLSRRQTSVPFLSFIFSDHAIDDPQWLSAGSTVVLGEYPDLEQYIYRHSTDLKTTAQDSDDTWYYVYNQLEGTLVLPKSGAFVQFADTPLDAGKFQKEGLPNIKGSWISKNAKNQMDTEPISYNDRRTVTGALSCVQKSGSTSYKYGIHGSSAGAGITAFYFDAGRSNPIYGASTGVQPKSNKFIPYFYVGEKKRPDEEPVVGGEE